MENDKLYPKLSEEAEKEAELYLQEFKEKMVKGVENIVNDTLSKVYVSCLGYIETDAWHNFRNELLDGFKGYKNAKIHQKYDFVKVRKQIFEENREEIIKDLNQDLLDEIEDLKNTIKLMNENRYYH